MRSEKRQCSVQVTFRPRGVQPKIAVISRGIGKRISQAEQYLYTDGVHVLWKNKSWADRQVCLNWAETALKDCLDERHVRSDVTRQDTLHFYGNIDGQIFPSLFQLNRFYRSFFQFFPKNLTDNLDPPDTGMIALIKYRFGIFLDQCLW